MKLRTDLAKDVIKKVKKIKTPFYKKQAKLIVDLCKRMDKLAIKLNKMSGEK